ncbi:Kelch domain-containing protein 3 [Portunus trituberculatus]|uniref:Kelch domain-containing protein 3 n=1 Tax=Portunus trituberculatus TaxID=210409 RepID=A0A5B7JEG8_PORTR|nr:Kelch domain-containing protein 3 [Portunus trituberculatus]
MKLFVLADTHLWSVPDVKGLVPEARDGHSACIVNDHMYIFSGYLEYVESYTQEVHTLNLRSMTWSYVRTTVSFNASLVRLACSTPYSLYFGFSIWLLCNFFILNLKAVMISTVNNTTNNNLLILIY